METFASRLKFAIKSSGFNQSKLARAIDVKPQAIQYLCDEKNNAQGSTHIYAISQTLGVNVDWLLQGKGEIYLNSKSVPVIGINEFIPEYGPTISAYRSTPIVGTAQLGTDGYWYETEYPVGHGDGYVDVPTKDPNAYSLRVRGQSMAPAIRDGWLVVCEPNKEPVSGEYVLVKTVDGRSMVKELLYSKAEGISLMSVNDGYGRINLSWQEIDKIHAISFIVPPSKHRL